MKNSIFRQEALQRYMQGREENVLPRFVSPPAFAFLWGGLILLVLGASFAWSVQVPLHVSGTAIAVNDPTYRPGGMALATLWPPETLSQLHVGQTVFLQSSPAGHVRCSIVDIEPETLSPDTVYQRFNLQSYYPLSQPATVALAACADWPSRLPADRYMGSIYQAEVEVGAQRLLSLLPLIGGWFR